LDCGNIFAVNKSTKIVSERDYLLMEILLTIVMKYWIRIFNFIHFIRRKQRRYGSEITLYSNCKTAESEKRVLKYSQWSVL